MIGLQNYWKKLRRKKSLDKFVSKVFYGRFLSIILKKKLKSKIEDDEGDTLNVHKVMSPKLFEICQKNPMENKKLKVLGNISRRAPKSNKGKRKAIEVKVNNQIQMIL